MADQFIFKEDLGVRISLRPVLSASDTYHPADPYHYGFTNPHVALLDGSPEKYGVGTAYAILRKDFEIGSGFNDLRREDSKYISRREDSKYISKEFYVPPSRGWKAIERLCEEMPFEEALRIAEERARRDNVVLYDNRSSGCTFAYNDPKRILWTPKNWKAEIG